MSVERPVFILAGDSRICGFDSFDYPGFRFLSVIKRGALISDLHEETLELVRKYKDVDRPVIVKIACGINEYTKFVKRDSVRELRYKSGVSNSNIINKLNLLKQEIKAIRPATVVGFITVPTLSFQKYRDTKKDDKKKTTLKSDSDLEKDQSRLDNKLSLLNASIKFENSRKQSGVCKGCYTVSWHNTIAKRTTRKRRSGSRILIKNNFDSLYDGLHAKRSLKQKWHEQLLKCVNAEVKLIREYNLKCTKVVISNERDTWDFKRKA